MKTTLLCIWFSVFSTISITNIYTVEHFTQREIVHNDSSKDISLRVKRFIHKHPLLATGACVVAATGLLIGLDYIFNGGKATQSIIGRVHKVYDDVCIIKYEEALEKTVCSDELTADERTILRSIQQLNSKAQSLLLWWHSSSDLPRGMKLTQEQFDEFFAEVKDELPTLLDAGLISIQRGTENTIMVDNIEPVDEVTTYNYVVDKAQHALAWFHSLELPRDIKFTQMAQYDDYLAGLQEDESPEIGSMQQGTEHTIMVDRIEPVYKVIQNYIVHNDFQGQNRCILWLKNILSQTIL